jgi:hypothetical protein
MAASSTLADEDRRFATLQSMAMVALLAGMMAMWPILSPDLGVYGTSSQPLLWIVVLEGVVSMLFLYFCSGANPASRVRGRRGSIPVSGIKRS